MTTYSWNTIVDVDVSIIPYVNIVTIHIPVYGNGILAMEYNI